VSDNSYAFAAIGKIAPCEQCIDEDIDHRSLGAPEPICSPQPASFWCCQPFAGVDANLLVARSVAAPCEATFMAREANLFDESGGSPVRAYLLLKSQGSANIPPAWIDRARASRKKREGDVAKVLKKGRVTDFVRLEDWELAYRKEVFYHGLRVLLELERKGRTKL
jgi:hypothetical protein